MDLITTPGFEWVVLFQVAAKHVAIHRALVGRVDPAIDRSRIDMSRESERSIAGLTEPDAVRVDEILIGIEDRTVRRLEAPEFVQEGLGRGHRRIGTRLHLRL